MTQQQIWEAAYLQSRYMQRLSRADLDLRFFDIINNYSNITPDGLIGITGFEDKKFPNLYWLEAFSHISFEFRLRGIGIPDAHRPAMSLFQSENYQYDVAATAIKSIDLSRPFLARFSSRDFISQMLNQGRIRIGPASSYEDESLNVAQRDNELVYDERDADSDFLVYFMTMDLKPRLFADFKADAAIVVYRPDEFLRRLNNAVKVLLPDWRWFTGAVKYFDPLRPDTDPIPPGFSKRFGFAYQQEWRFIFRPKNRIRKLTPIFVELGSLADIAQAIFLPEKNEPAAAIG